MNTAALLNEVTRRGIRLEPDGDALCYTAPKDLLTPELMAKVKAHKSELLDILRKPGAVFWALTERGAESGEIPTCTACRKKLVYWFPLYTRNQKTRN